MNFFSLIGFLMAGLVFAYGVLTAAGNPMMFLNEHAILIVMGGSVASAAIAFQLDRILVLFKAFFHRVIRGKKTGYDAVVLELMQMAEAYRSGSGNLENLLKNTREPFLREALQTALDGVLDRHRLERVLRNRVSNQYHRYQDEALKFKTVGKYPPAFGLMGTTLGMIDLLTKIGQPGAMKLIGPSMAVALVATFWGLSLTNLVFGPVAENLMDSAKEMKMKHMIIIEGVLLILEKTNPIILCEELNSFLPPGDRIDWKSVVSAPGGASKGSKKAA